MRARLALLGAFLLLCVGSRVHAVITAKTPLSKFVGDADYIVVGKVDKYFADKPAMILTVTEDIKGKAPFRTLPINCKVTDEKTFKDNQIGPLLKRFGPDQEMVFFIRPRNKSLIAFAFCEGTWFHLQGKQTGDKEVIFNLLSAEPYFRKSFKGTTAELRKVLKDHAGGKAKLPELNDKEPPGFGPEYTPKKGARLGGGPLFGVIPTLGVGAPLAILAILFPSVFGGVFVLFRQWLAFITVISLNSTLVLIAAWLGPKFRGQWWATDSTLWIAMTGVTCACLLWAWRRHLDSLAAGEPDASRRTELLILLFMSVSCVSTLVVLGLMTPKISWADVGWTLTVVLTAGVVAGTIFRGYRMVTREPLFGAPPLTTEGVIVGTMALGHIFFMPVVLGGSIGTTGDASGGEQSGQMAAKVSTVREAWAFTMDARVKGMFVANPVIDGDALYASCSTTDSYATVIRLDRQTGLKKWEFFGKNDDLRQMMSTPCLADGKLYFGEGFHFDKNCHVFCVDAEKGEEVWRFKTGGQTESSPTVVHGKVYIGAGNDGVYCLDAKDGKVIWHYPKDAEKPERIQRFGGGMIVVGDRLYCGTGVDRAAEGDKGETAIFCFSARTGELIWKTPAPYPIWSTPVFKEGTLFVTSGNGDVLTDVEPPEKPGGALQSLDAEKGKELWQRKFDNGIIEAPAVDGHFVYFGCRDRHLYCVSRADGKDRWKPYFLETPIIATPVLDSDPVYERTLSVFVATTAGKICCMEPATGDIVWTYDLTPRQAVLSATPRLVVTRSPEGYRRQLYVGCGIGGAIDANNNRPVLYCLEDTVRVK